MTPTESEKEMINKIPHFDQYFGVWAIHDGMFLNAVEHFKSMDMSKHIDMAKGAAYTEDEKYAVSDGVAVIPIIGALTKYDSSISEGPSMLRLVKAIRAAAKDASVKSILLHVDSPGGTVAGTDELASAVAKANTIKPVVAFIDDLGASAAYWIASQAGKVIASPVASVGNVGVFTTLVDTSQRAKISGIKVHVIKTGAMKAIGESGVEVTPDQLAYLEDFIGKIGAKFVGAIKASRNLSDESEHAIADGRLFVADEAKALGLVDDVMRMEDVVNMLKNYNKREGEKAMTDEKGAKAMTDEKGAVAMEPISSIGSTAASIAELKSACVGADPAFLLAQAEAGATLQQAQTAWIAEQSARIDAMKSEMKRETKIESVVGVKALGSVSVDGKTPQDEDDPEGEWRSKVERKMVAGMTKRDAIIAVQREFPGLREAFVAAYNARLIAQ